MISQVMELRRSARIAALAEKRALATTTAATLEYPAPIPIDTKAEEPFPYIDACIVIVGIVGILGIVVGLPL